MSCSQTVAIVAVAVLCGCHKDTPLPATSTEAEPLRWLNHADVAADFTERVEHQHDTRFLSVYALNTPGAFGLDDIADVRQLIQRHGERHIDGTTDVIASAEHQRLLRNASEYVKQYNLLLLHYLRDHPDA